MTQEPFNTGAGPANWERPLTKPSPADPIHNPSTAEHVKMAVYGALVANYYYQDSKGRDLSTAGKKAKWAATATLKAIVIAVLSLAGLLFVFWGFWALLFWVIG